MIYQPLKRGLALFLGLVFACTYISNAQTQRWGIGIGSSLTTYDFVTSSGVKINYLKTGSGNSYFLGYESSLVDTNRFVGLGTSKAIYFLQHKTLAKVLSKVDYGVKILFNQYNAVGDIQNNAFDYQTNYAGLQIGIGPTVSLGKNWHLQAKGLASGQHILQGNQHVNFSYVDLTKDPAFSGLKVFVGYELSLEKQLSNSLRFFLTGSQNQTVQSQQAGVSTLNFKSTSLLIGIKISSIK